MTLELIQSPDQTTETNLANKTPFSVKSLQISPLRIYSENWIFVETKAICDTASSQIFIDEDLIQSLGFEGETFFDVSDYASQNEFNRLFESVGENSSGR